MARARAQAQKSPSIAKAVMSNQQPTKKDRKKEKKPRKWKPGTVVNREIKKQQSGQGKGLEKSTFERVVKGIAADVTKELLEKAEGAEGMQEVVSEHPFQTAPQGTNYADIKRWSANAKSTLLQATEEYLTDMFVMTKKSLLHRGAKKMKIKPADLQFALHMMSPESARVPILDKEDLEKAKKKELRRKKKEKKKMGESEDADAPAKEKEEEKDEEVDEDAYLSA